MRKESLNALEQLTGFDRRTIKKRLASLKPEKVGRSHLYQTVEALPLLYARDGGVYDTDQERARLLHHQANNEKLKEDQLRGSLIPEEVVKEYGSGMVSAFRAKLLSLHNKIRNRFTSLPKDVIDEIQDLHKEALQELGTDGIPSEIRDRIRQNLQRSDTAS